MITVHSINYLDDNDGMSSVDLARPGPVPGLNDDLVQPLRLVVQWCHEAQHGSTISRRQGELFAHLAVLTRQQAIHDLQAVRFAGKLLIKFKFRRQKDFFKFCLLWTPYLYRNGSIFGIYITTITQSWAGDHLFSFATTTAGHRNNVIEHL